MTGKNGQVKVWRWVMARAIENIDDQNVTITGHDDAEELKAEQKVRDSLNILPVQASRLVSLHS